jgi:hypothetical protein
MIIKISDEGAKSKYRWIKEGFALDPGYKLFLQISYRPVNRQEIEKKGLIICSQVFENLVSKIIIRTR